MINKDSIIDCLGFILLKFLGPLVRFLPKGCALGLGKLCGEILYAFDLKHRAQVYANIKTALGDRLSPCRIRFLTRSFYQAFGQNLFEIFFIPLIDKDYIRKYVTIRGLENIRAGFSRGKGIIFLAVHAGSWELCNIIAANLGFKFSMFVRQQKFPRLERLLNSYRKAKGCCLIQREDELRELIRVIRANESVVLTLDQGGRNGLPIEFFRKDASMASGAVRLALKYDTSLIPVFLRRKKGPYIELSIEPVFELIRTGEPEKDISENLRQLVRVFERYIRAYPQEYLWSYKVWKYSRARKVLLLSDGKAGHLRQAQGLAKIIAGFYRSQGLETQLEPVEVRFKNRFFRCAFSAANLFAAGSACQGCLACLKMSLQSASYECLIRQKADIVISCGSSLAGVNYLLSRENQARSLVIMRTGIMDTRRFDLVIQSRHDHPPQAKNVLTIEGALNLIDPEYLKEQSEQLLEAVPFKGLKEQLCLGLLLGGNTKEFRMSLESMRLLIAQLKDASQQLDAQLLISTSRRTPKDIAELLKREFNAYHRCKLLVIANENNFPFSVGGILGLSQLVVISPESISMVSEAAASNRYVVVFGAKGLKARHKEFLDDFSRRKYIYLCPEEDLSRSLKRLWSEQPKIHSPNDNQLALDALKKVLR
jgi:KDO2-lipid IV(A) lauroyltransferase